VIGDAANNTISITDDGRGNVSVTADGGQAVTASGINRIDVDTRGGDDTFSYALTAALEGDRNLSVRLGGGNDRATIEAADGIARGTFAVQMEGREGADSLTVTLGAIAAGARADVRADGDEGNDTINLAFTGDLDGELRLRAEGDDGNDTITTNVTLAAGSTGRLEAEVRGGKGDDTLTLTVNGDTGGLNSFKALLDGDDGNDTATATANVTVEEAEQVRRV
jgi:hypothetical protein